MNNTHYYHLFSFIWDIDNDVLVHAFERVEYKKIIIPMTVALRPHILLERTKDVDLESKAQLDAASFSFQDPVLFQVTTYPFCNLARFMMKRIKAKIDPIHFKMIFIEYLNGFNKDAQEVMHNYG